MDLKSLITERVKETLDESNTATINSPGHKLHGKTGRVFYKHPDGRVNVQVQHSQKKGDVTNVTLKKGEYTLNEETLLEYKPKVLSPSSPNHPNHAVWKAEQKANKAATRTPVIRAPKEIDPSHPKLHKEFENYLGGSFEHYEGEPKHTTITDKEGKTHAAMHVVVTHSYTHEDFGMHPEDMEDTAETHRVTVVKKGDKYHVMHRMANPMHEETELEELNRSTLVSYVKKAAPDAEASQKATETHLSNANATASDDEAEGHYKLAMAAKNRTDKRIAGVTQAISKIKKMKESTELEESGLKTSTLQSYKTKATTSANKAELKGGEFGSDDRAGAKATLAKRIKGLQNANKELSFRQKYGNPDDSAERNANKDDGKEYKWDGVDRPAKAMHNGRKVVEEVELEEAASFRSHAAARKIIRDAHGKDCIDGASEKQSGGSVEKTWTKSPLSAETRDKLRAAGHRVSEVGKGHVVATYKGKTGEAMRDRYNKGMDDMVDHVEHDDETLEEQAKWRKQTNRPTGPGLGKTFVKTVTDYGDRVMKEPIGRDGLDDNSEPIGKRDELSTRSALTKGTKGQTLQPKSVANNVKRAIKMSLGNHRKANLPESVELEEQEAVRHHIGSGTKASAVTYSSKKLSSKPTISKSDVSLVSGAAAHKGRSVNFPKGTEFKQLPGGVFGKHPDVKETHPGFGHIVRSSPENLAKLHGSLNEAVDCRVCGCTPCNCTHIIESSGETHFTQVKTKYGSYKLDGKHDEDSAASKLAMEREHIISVQHGESNDISGKRSYAPGRPWERDEKSGRSAWESLDVSIKNMIAEKLQ